MKLFKQFKPGLNIILLSILLISCSKESQLLPELEKEAQTLQAESRRPGISPSGDLTGATDADVIEQALIAAIPGETVTLRKGIFYINRPIVAPTGFNGNLKGKNIGKGGTRIIAVGSPAAPFGITTVSNYYKGFPPNGEVDLPAMFYFPEPSGSIMVSDMELVAEDGLFTETWSGFPGFNQNNDLAYMIYVWLGNSEANTNFKNLKLQGTNINPNNPAAGFFIFQPEWALKISGKFEDFPILQSGGTHHVKNCNFDKMGTRPIEHQLFKNASIEIKDNTLTNIKQVATVFLDGTSLSIKNNSISHQLLGGLLVTQEGLSVGTAPCTIEIENNVLETRVDLFNETTAGIEIGGAPNFDVDIRNNFIQLIPLNNFAPLNGIVINGNDGAVVKNNEITGQSNVGISLVGVSNGTLEGNDLSNLTTNFAGYYLNQLTNNCTVIIPDNATVVDEGTNNTIIQ